MITPAQVRELALALPEAQEKQHFGQPDFRVANKIFAGLAVDGKRATLKLPVEVQISAIALAPQVFSLCAGAWGRSGWTYVDLALVDRAMFSKLLEEAWRTVAPKRLIRGGTQPHGAKMADTPNTSGKLHRRKSK